MTSLFAKLKGALEDKVKAQDKTEDKNKKPDVKEPKK